MTEELGTQKKPTWATWMHVAGVAYPFAIWAFVVAAVVGGPMFQALSFAALAALTVGTFAFIGGIGRYLATKK